MPVFKSILPALVAIALPCASVIGAFAFAARPAPVIISAAELTVNPANGKRVHKGEPFTGVAQKLHANGRVAESDAYVDGLRHGPSQIWFADGQKSYEMHFENGLREGVAQTWWSNGLLRSQTEFVRDKPEGAAWVWYASGETFKRHFYKSGVPTGLQKAWRKNGKLYENFEIRNGRSYGLRNTKICVEIKDQSV